MREDEWFARATIHWSGFTARCKRPVRRERATYSRTTVREYRLPSSFRTCPTIIGPGVANPHFGRRSWSSPASWRAARTPRAPASNQRPASPAKPPTEAARSRSVPCRPPRSTAPRAEQRSSWPVAARATCSCRSSQPATSRSPRRPTRSGRLTRPRARSSSRLRCSIARRRSRRAHPPA